jgi:hypothetical protein
MTDIYSTYLRLRDDTTQTSSFVRHTQMRDVLKTFQTLDVHEAQQVFEWMRPQPALLNDLADDLTTTFAFGLSFGGAEGLTQDELTALFDTWAKQLTGAQLASALDAFGSRGKTALLSEAIAEHSSADVTLEMLEAMPLNDAFALYESSRPNPV